MPPLSAQTLSALELAQVRLGELFVHTPSHAHALEQMQNCITRYVRLGHPCGFLLVGDSGTGKTRTLEILERWARKTYPDLGERKQLFLKADLPADCTPRGLAGAFLEAAGDGFAWRRGTQQDREGRVRRMFDEVDPLAAVLDEAQNAFEAKTANETKLVCQALKNHYNACQRPMVLSGMPALLQKVASSEELHQRFQNFAVLPTYSLANPELLAEFRGVVTELASIVPFAPELDSSDDSIMLRLLLASGGTLRRLIQVCTEACQVAEIRDAKHVDLTHLSQGFRNLLRSKSGVRDPFTLDDEAVRDEAARELRRQQQRRDNTSPGDAGKPGR